VFARNELTTHELEGPEPDSQLVEPLIHTLTIKCGISATPSSGSTFAPRALATEPIARTVETGSVNTLTFDVLCLKAEWRQSETGREVRFYSLTASPRID
jgi:hypothetical protein